jgi:Na+/H+-dicarboxylate symporter
VVISSSLCTLCAQFLPTSANMSATDANKKGNPVDDDFMDEEMPPAGFGILGRYPVLSVLGFAAAGIGLGVGLSSWEPDDADQKTKTLKWIGLVGDLFIRSLKAIVLPLVFINVSNSVVDMMGMGRASTIGYKVVGLYLLTTLIASTIGVISIVSFKGLFEQGFFEESDPPQITLGCNAENTFLTEMSDGSLMCSASGSEEDINFFFNDLTSTLVKKSSGPKNDISLSDTIYDGVFIKLVSSNIFESFVKANFASVAVFAIVFGCALGRVLFKKQSGADLSTNTILSGSPVMRLFKELDAVFLQLINWVIMVTPFAVFSLITNAIGKQDDLKQAFANVGYLVLATLLAIFAHFLVVDVGLLLFIRKKNPFTYLKQLIPAQTMAFACASSAATIPQTLRCVRGTGEVPESILRFVIPLGATVNMDGSAIYFPISCVWLAVLNGEEINASSYFLLIIIATIGSAGSGEYCQNGSNRTLKLYVPVSHCFLFI